jgi:translation initiation factor 3 subunit I
VRAAVDSTRLLTGSADSSAKLWDVETGQCLFTFKHKAPCKGVAFGLGDAIAAISTDPFMTTTPAIHIVRIADEAAEQSADAVQVRFLCKAAKEVSKEQGGGCPALCA